MSRPLPEMHPDPAARERLRDQAIGYITEGIPLGQQLATGQQRLTPDVLDMTARALAQQTFPTYGPFALAHVVAGIKKGYDPQQYEVVLE